MAGIDASIPLGFQQPDGMKTISSLLGMKSALQNQQIQDQNIQANAMSNQQSQIDLQETQAAQGVMKNIKQYQDADGNIDYNKLLPDMMTAAPKNGAKFVGNVMQMQNQANVAKQSWLGASAAQRDAIGKIAYSLQGQAPDVVAKTFDAVRGAPAFQNMTPSLDHMWSKVLAPAIQGGSQKQIDDGLSMIGKMSEQPSTQQGMNSPGLSFVPTAAGTQAINTKANIQGIPLGAVGAPMTPPNQVINTTGGGAALANPASGTVHPFQGGPAVDFPPGENKDTQAALQDQRTASQNSANQAPAMHNLNRSIITEADKGLNTGKLGELTQKFSSATGFNIGNQSATDYNVLGKMLERSALTAAQGMGPHTNAGLEAQVRANGSTDYTPQAIRKIAALNDAMTTGSTLYQNGLEKSIGSGGIFSKRQFDQQWANAMNPNSGVDGVQALRFKNAVDSQDAKEIAEITKEVGGPNSKGAAALYQKLQALHRLAGVQ